MTLGNVIERSHVDAQGSQSISSLNRILGTWSNPATGTFADPEKNCSM